jgi:hypothetical protein
MTKYRGIPFSGPLVLKIMTCAQCGHISVPFPCEKCGSVEFVKTVTRRVIKNKFPSAYDYYPGDDWWIGPHPGGGWWALDNPDGASSTIINMVERKKHTGFKAPYNLGETVYVKEALRPKIISPSEVVVSYAADNKIYRTINGPLKTWPKPWPWKVKTLPSIFCPEWASRLPLTVINIRPERLHKITAKDALAEGIEYDQHYEGLGNPCDEIRIFNTFEALWNDINGAKFPWKSNPWVWRIEFNRNTGADFAGWRGKE